MGPALTIHQFLCLTGEAETDTMLEATEALDLSRGAHGPAADVTGVGIAGSL